MSELQELILPECEGIPTVEEIIGRCEVPLSEKSAALIRKAYDYAEESHRGQKRKSGRPYFEHCARVGWLLATLLNDPATIAAGLLHDTVEDCGISVDELSKDFPDPIPQLVDGVTKISSLNYTSDEQMQADNLRKMILAMAKDVRVVLIKLCDRLHNMQTLEHLRPDRQKAIAQATLDIYAPLASRLGITRIKIMLEDLCMQYLHPLAYRQISQIMDVRSKRDQAIVDMTKQILGDKLSEQNIDFDIQGRRKHIYSLHQKMLSSGRSLDEVHDILAIRVLTGTIQECYEILGVVHSLWKPLTGRFKDYIAGPKENGYRSIHTTVIGVEREVIEVQIRTMEMHNIAEEGIAAHWKYKDLSAKGNGNSGASAHAWGAEEEKLAWLRQLVEWLQEVHDPSEFMRELKRDVYENSVFCYTPKGEIMELPQGSTALDMAYRIHTDLGHRCAGARINNQMASIRTILKTGDIVDILTSKTAHPTPDWLNIVRSGRARNKIRHWLKSSQRDEYLERGRRMLFEQARNQFGRELVANDKVLKILEGSLNQYSVPTIDDLLVEIGCGTIKLASVMGKVESVVAPQQAQPKQKPRHVKRNQKRKDVVLVEGMSGAVTRMAKCCSPLPGDEIIGFITQGRGISVHRADCKSLDNARDRIKDFDSRVVSVQWGDEQNTQMKAAVRLICQDRRGLLNDVTSAISALDVFIVGSNTTSNIRDNRAILKMTILVESTDQLNMVLNRLQAIPGVLSVTRALHAQ